MRGPCSRRYACTYAQDCVFHLDTVLCDAERRLERNLGNGDVSLDARLSALGRATRPALRSAMGVCGQWCQKYYISTVHIESHVQLRVFTEA